MDRKKIFFKWILPLGTILFAYFSIGSIVDSNLTIENLVKINGRVIKYEYYYSSTRYSTHKNLKIYVDNGKSYKIPYEWVNKFDEIEQELARTKEIELFHRTELQRIWRLGTSDIVYQLEIGSKMIINITDRQSMSRGLSYFLGFISLIGFIIIVFRKYKKN